MLILTVLSCSWITYSTISLSIKEKKKGEDVVLLFVIVLGGKGHGIITSLCRSWWQIFCDISVANLWCFKIVKICHHMWDIDIDTDTGLGIDTGFLMFLYFPF